MTKDDADGTANPEKPTADYIEFATNWYRETGAAPVHCDQRLLHEKSKCWACAIPIYQPLHDFRAQHDINYSGETGRKYPCPVESIRSVKQAHTWAGNTPRTEAQRDADFKKFSEELRKAMDDVDSE